MKIVDFDLAQPIDEKPMKITQNPGTPAYMAPEQLRGEAIPRALTFLFLPTVSLRTNC